MNTTATSTDLQTYVDSLSFTYIPTFRPTPQPGEKSPQLHWLITLERGKERMTFDYRQGMGHVQNYKQCFKTRHERRVAEGAYRRTCETGKLRTGYEVAGPFTTQPAPKLLDVLYCLVSDASVRHYPFPQKTTAKVLLYIQDPGIISAEEIQSLLKVSHPVDK